MKCREMSLLPQPLRSLICQQSQRPRLLRKLSSRALGRSNGPSLTQFELIFANDGDNHSLFAFATLISSSLALKG